MLTHIERNENYKIDAQTKAIRKKENPVQNSDGDILSLSTRRSERARKWKST